MKKIISFCLYGHDPKYTIGSLCNVELAKIIYPEWICRIYYGKSVPTDIIERLSNYDNVELVHMDEDNKTSYMTWRFLPIDDDDVEIMLSRDTDSRLSFREKKLVDIFIESEYLLHDIRDHGCHTDLMGGTWGMKKNSKINMKELINNASLHNAYGIDQFFMRDNVVPKFVDDRLIHFSNYNPANGSYLKDFPVSFDEVLSPLIGTEHHTRHFIGEVFSADNGGKPLNYVFY